MTSTKFQINLKYQKFNDQNSFKLFDYSVIDIWNLFVICFLLFGTLFQNLFDFMDKHSLVKKYITCTKQYDNSNL